MHNIMIEEINVETVNRLLYAGSYLVCETLGAMKKIKGRGERKKRGGNVV